MSRIVNDPIRSTAFARLLFELGYIPELNAATTCELFRRVDKARARGVMKPDTRPARRAGSAPSYFQLTDARATELSRSHFVSSWTRLEGASQ